MCQKKPIEFIYLLHRNIEYLELISLDMSPSSNFVTTALSEDVYLFVYFKSIYN